MRPSRPALIAALTLALVAAACGDSGRALPLDPSAADAPVTPASVGRLLQVELPPVEVAPGTATLLVAVLAPDGFDPSNEAPSRLTLDAANRSVVDLTQREVDWISRVPEAGWPVPARLAPGSTTITASGTVYFCRTGEAEVCLIQRVELTLPVTVSSTSTAGALELRYRLPPLSSP